MASPSMFYAVLRDRIAALKTGRSEPQGPDRPGYGHGPATAGHTNAEAFQAVCRMLDDRHGRKIPSTPQGTLNRLFSKHLATHQPAWAGNAPELTDENVWVTRETRPKLSFVGLSRRLESGPKISVDGGHPIVIARYRGLDLLLDGNKRCRFWYRHADRGLHDAYVLIVRETGSP